LFLFFWIALMGVLVVQALGAQESFPRGEVVLLATNGAVEVLRDGARRWDFATPLSGKSILYPGDQLRIGRGSDATVRLADQTIARLGPETHLRVLDPLPREASLGVLFGRLFFLHRDQPGRVRVSTATVTAAIEGTEFSLEVAEADGTTWLDLFDGKVTMTNAAGELTLTSGHAGLTRPGLAPVATAMIAAVNIIQWNLYYPAVLNLDELPLRNDTRALLKQSLLAYQRGNLPGAAAHYPEGRAPISAEEKVYLAAVRLGAGQTDEALDLLDSLPSNDTNQTTRLASALRLLVAAAKFLNRPSTPNLQPATSTEWLAESYYQQSRFDLEAARDAVRKAVSTAPEFGFALARLAELEFSFGRIAPAHVILDRSLALSPENPQAVALQGFLLAARNQVAPAIAAFDRAIALDSGLANAWLGRGLCRIRQGKIEEGREDLLVAAATEPQRAILRSYLGKALIITYEHPLARHELELAKQFDKNDPTAWLYSALLNQLDNRINRAVSDLERSQALNDNRAVYRSRELLDQDRAVRGVNLANIYHDATLTTVAYREAVRAVHEDYANFSAHLFLANSFNRLRDPRQFNLRYESPWLSEYLVANLLAPVGGGTLSQLVSTEEYSRLFERDRLGLVSTTEYLSNGDWLQAAAQYGRAGNFAYALEEVYRSQNGYWPNGDSERLTVSAQSKVQISPKDDIFLQAIYYDAEGGDLAQHHSVDEVNRSVRFEETQEPLLIAGYHRAWTPFSHTLLMAARLHDSLSFTNSVQSMIDLDLDRVVPGSVGRFPLPLHYESELEIYTAELQHIWQWRNYVTIVGARYQTGEFDTTNAMPEIRPSFLAIPATAKRVEADLERVTMYAYQHWEPLSPLRLIGGLSYDRLTFPENFRNPPISSGDESTSRLSPKAGLIWSLATNTTVRGAYTRSLGGVSIDQSFQLEPAQVAGFAQTFRSLLPESVAGSAAASRHETFGLALDQKLPTGTYLGVAGEWLESKGTRQVGAFRYPFSAPFPAVPSITPEELHFRERTLHVSANQLLGEQWAVGLAYRVSKADLSDEFTEVPSGTEEIEGFVRREHLEATLHQIHWQAAWSSPIGLFATFDSVFSSQDNSGYSPRLLDDHFWQFNIFAGYRFPRRKAELSIGLLNITDQDYRLNPLNLTPELPRERTLAVRFRMAF
jgi:Tfp pilus assembly protein PilF